MSTSSQVLFAPIATSTDVEDQFSSAGSVRSGDNQTIAETPETRTVDEVHTEYFQVDRHKLQKMFKAERETKGLGGAESFFRNIMHTTETYINWPRKLDTNNKQDPYIRIFGKPNDVSWAKGLILSRLETRGPLLKLKIAISNVDHLYVIGRDNFNVNFIMDQTDTHIQFPDANQRNVLKKGNQVSIFGNLEGLHRARILLRSSTPLVMCFDLPNDQPLPNFEHLEFKFNVQIIVSSKQNSNLSSVYIKGSSSKVDMIKEATRALINSTYGQQATKTLVSVQLEIPPQYQETVKGEDNANLTTIMENTKTKIFFPDLSMRGNVKQRSQVTITGSIDGVCSARDELERNLPAELTFDIPGENQCKATEIMNLGTKFGVCITLSQKERDNALAVTVKAKEKFIDKIYEVHRDILKLKADNATTEEEVPKAFHLLEGAYQKVMDTLVNNYMENVVERTENIFQPFATAGDLQVAQTNTVLEQFCSAYIEPDQLQTGPTYTPDSGHSSGNAYQGGDIYPYDWNWISSGFEGVDAIQPMYSAGAQSLAYINQNLIIEEEAYYNQYLDQLREFGFENNQFVGSASLFPTSPLFIRTPEECAEWNHFAFNEEPLPFPVAKY